MNDIKVIAEVKQCPYCKCKETVIRKAFQMAEVEIPTSVFPGTGNVYIPLTNPQSAIVAIKAVQLTTDYCANPNCGRQYMTRAAVVEMPIQFMQATGQSIPPHMRRG